MKIEFFNLETKEAVINQYLYYVNEYGYVYEDKGCEECDLCETNNIGWRVLEE